MAPENARGPCPVHHIERIPQVTGCCKTLWVCPACEREQLEQLYRHVTQASQDV
jgi:hypothetical protein